MNPAIGTTAIQPDCGSAANGTPPAASGSGGSVRYVADGPQAARVEVDAPAPAILLIRTVYDPGWTARVDGRVVPVLPADSLIQAVPVPAGRHIVELAYRDPSIGLGLLGSAVSIATILGAALFIRKRRRRPVPRSPAA